MTASTIKLTASSDDQLIARYALAAIGLSIAEAALPSPLPGVKPGLANIVTLIVLYRHGWGMAVWVSFLRIFAASLAMGQFLAPGFFLSLSGALASLAVLFFAVRLPQRWFGPVSLSLLASCCHVLAQLLLARLWLVPHPGLWVLLPIFITAACFFGILNGLIVTHFIKQQYLTSGQA